MAKKRLTALAMRVQAQQVAAKVERGEIGYEHGVKKLTGLAQRKGK